MANDEKMLFHWRNLPWVISLGERRRSVEWEEHHMWFVETLKKEKRCLFIVEIGTEPAGMLRYDFIDGTAVEISIFLMPEIVGHGVGTRAFLISLPRMLSWRPASMIIARVLDGNKRSSNFFEKLGFIIDGLASSSSVTVLTRHINDIQHSRPFVGPMEAEAVSAVIASGHLVQGQMIRRLEQYWCQLTSMDSAAGVGSGVGALRLALLALGIEQGDEVIVPAYSCVALINSVLALGATPVLADVLMDNWTLSPDDAQRCITNKTKAIIAVHLFGASAAMPVLIDLGLPVVEDCAHGIGGRCGARPFGGAGTVSISSFYATKMIAAGEGGIVAAHDSAIIDRVLTARDHGDQLPNRHHLNDKMTDIEAALAYEQLKRLSEMLSLRAERAERYNSWLAALIRPGLIVLPECSADRIWYRYVIRLVHHSAPQICEWMAEHGVRVEQPVWDLRAASLWADDLNVTAQAFDRVISLPLYPDLDELDQERVVTTFVHCIETL